MRQLYQHPFTAAREGLIFAICCTIAFSNGAPRRLLDDYSHCALHSAWFQSYLFCLFWLEKREKGKNFQPSWGKISTWFVYLPLKMKHVENSWFTGRLRASHQSICWSGSWQIQSLALQLFPNVLLKTWYGKRFLIGQWRYQGPWVVWVTEKIILGFQWWFPIGISFSRGLFSGAMLVSGRVFPWNRDFRFSMLSGRWNIYDSLNQTI